MCLEMTGTVYIPAWKTLCERCRQCLQGRTDRRRW